MNCQQIDKYIFGFCEHILPPELESRIQEHLEKCPICRNKVEFTLLENEVLQDNTDLPVLDASFTSNLLNHIKSESNTQHISQKGGLIKRFRIPQAFYIPAMAIVILLCALLIPALSDLQSDIKIADKTNNSDTGKPGTHYDSILVDTESSTREMQKDALLDAGDSPQQGQTTFVAGTEENNTTTPTDKEASSTTANKVLKSPVNEESIDHREINKPPEPMSANTSTYVYPVELPADFQLLQIISGIDNELNYVFLDTSSEEKLLINISPLQTEALSVASTDKTLEKDAFNYQSMGEAEDSANNPVFTRDPSPEAQSSSLEGRGPALSSTGNYGNTEDQVSALEISANNSINWDINLGKQYYRISLSADCSPEKLAQIAKIIEFKEENIHE